MKEKNVFTDHEYDGIEELDNDLPRWWLYLFYVTIVFAFVYMVYYHATDLGYSSEEKYEREMNPEWVRSETKPPAPSYGFRSPWKRDDVEITPKLLTQFQDFIGEDISFEELITEAKRRATADQFAILDEAFPGETVQRPAETKAVERVEEIITPLMDEVALSKGAEIYKVNCAVCHGSEGQGLIGPNFADQYWIHGGSMNDIVRLINVGVPAKGMIPWDKTLSPDQIIQVSSFIISLEGTDPQNQKPPEGDLYKR